MAIVTNLKEAFNEIVNAYLNNNDIEELGRISKCIENFCYDVTVFADDTIGRAYIVMLVNDMKTGNLTKLIIYDEGRDECL